MSRVFIQTVRRVFAMPPFRQVRDAMLRLGYTLDPSLSALRDVVQWREERAAQRQLDELEHWSWHRLDPLYARLKRALRRQTVHGRTNWRYSPEYTRMIVKEAMAALRPHVDVLDKHVVDVGCGNHNPVGVSIVFFLNGACQTLAVDMEPCDTVRAAEATHDLLQACALTPNDWHWSGISRDAFLERIQRFDLKALRDGDLDAGLAGVPVHYRVVDVHDGIPVDPGSVDIMFTRDVLEHIEDMPVAMQVFNRVTQPGGIGYHHIDLMDHRIYKNLDPADFTPEYLQGKPGYPRNAYHAWSFLLEPDDYKDPICNRYRAPDYRVAFEEAGFDILAESAWRTPPPPGLRQQLPSRYQTLSEDDLAICQMDFVLRKRN